MKQKLFNFTDRTVELLKIVSALNGTSETETLEIALELMATPEVIALIKSIHGERVDRKTLRKPRTSKKKEKAEPIKKETFEVVKQNNSVSTVEDTKEIHQEYKSDTLEEKEEDINDSVFDLNMCDDSLLDMYS